MSIRVQQTPNPNARKFVLPRQQFPHSTNYATPEAAREQPLAAQLFALGGVYNVFLAQDFITVNKLADVDWADLEPRILVVIDQAWAEMAKSTEANRG